MSHCANYVLRIDGVQLVANSRWGALTVPADVFFGPDQTVSFLIDATAPDRGLGFLYDEGLCEGAIFADYDARRLVVFGGEDLRYEKVLQHAYIEMLARAWPGWDVAWASGGWRQIAVAAGLPFEPEHHRAAVPIDALVPWTPPPDWTAPIDADRFLSNRASGPLSLVTICDPSGTRDHLVAAFAEKIMATGPHILDLLVAVPPTPPVPAFHAAQLGLIVDVRTHTVHYWIGKEERSWDAAELAASWSGWTIARDDTGVPAHLVRTGRDPSAVAIRGSILRDVVIRGELSNLAEDALAELVTEMRERAGQPGVVTGPGVTQLPPPQDLGKHGRRAFVAGLLAQFPDDD